MTGLATRLALSLVALVALSACDGSAEQGGGDDAAASLDGGGSPAETSDAAALDIGPPGELDAEDAGVSPDVPDVDMVPDVPEVDDDPPPLDLSPLGGDRPAAVNVPSDYDPDVAWPVVVLLHGYAVNGFIQDVYLGVSAQVDPLGFIQIIPEGTVDSQGNQFWDGAGCCNFDGAQVDDVSYLLGLLDEAIERFHVDEDRVYLFGHSNGGFMSYRLACEAAERIAGIGVLAGGTWVTPALCSPSAPVSVLHIHGTLDTTIEYAGDFWFAGAQAATAQWVGHDGCDLVGAGGGPIDYDQDVLGAETSTLSWGDCEAGSRVSLWTLAGSGHVPVVQETFTHDALSWLLETSKP